MTASAILTISGALCVYLSGQVMYLMRERKDRPAGQWMSTFLGASSVAMLVIILLLAGLTLVAKGLLSI